MSNIHYVVRHGKRIRVATLDPPKSSRRGVPGLFAKVNLNDAAGIAKALGSPLVLIVPLLIHLAWKTKSATFPLPNKLLARYGINRKTKYWVLRRLEKAEWLSLRKDPGKVTIVTLLTVPGDAPPP